MMKLDFVGQDVLYWSSWSWLFRLFGERNVVVKTTYTEVSVGSTDMMTTFRNYVNLHLIFFASSLKVLQDLDW